MLGPIVLSGSCAGGLFMGVFWFLVIMGGIALLRLLPSNQKQQEL